ncbi:small glutamine-rich tetratricopeptide repeat-containing protein isoform X2 [Telopea speciosissima]|uniref:small glutamine-rich tetratricopeptide repeat-containing protein isoform X2 n=1 Tax=Telopea speciosissima TaxID=54955 RepID=UPI001CC60DC1|nr:small glutamine-rich tetratricopeptide repeat-containing protein isoform X2 [Telopea speciosissima]
MAKLKTDSPISRRIVLAFLDFLKSVEPTPGVDVEALEVATECLEEVFKPSQSSVDDRIEPDFLVTLFHSLDKKKHVTKSELGHGEVSLDMDTPSTSSSPNAVDGSTAEALKPLSESWNREQSSGVSKDDLFGQFISALEKLDFFKTRSDGKDDQACLDKASNLFHGALQEIERSGCQTINQKNLAEMLKSRGNRAMQSKLYSDAIELYTCAIALCQNNAVYYCNRAAAYTHIKKCTEAIGDCLKSIEIDPTYIKAYSRLGLAYYAQGNYNDAINKGFKKALQLDPNNDSIKENIRVAEQKLNEEMQRTFHEQANGSTWHYQQGSWNHGPPPDQQQSMNHGPPPTFTAPAFDPANLASMLMNLAANAYQGQNQQAQNNPHDASGREDQEGMDEPGIRIDGNITLNFQEELPEELSGAWSNVMDALSGATRHDRTQGNMNDGSAPN